MNYTRRELEKRIGIASETASKAARSHLRAIQATHSMTSQSQRRAQSGNVVAAAGEEKIAIRGALEIYDLFPEWTKEAKPDDFGHGFGGMLESVGPKGKR
jgi:hypothetical protein